MKQTLFPKFVTAQFRGVTLAIQSKLAEATYAYESMLNRVYSIDGTWNAVSNINRSIAADVVALDSPLPLKSRKPLSSASGEVPKLGMEMQLNETQLTQIDTMIKLGGEPAIITQKIFEDIASCIKGVKEKTEYIFLQGLSSGVALINQTNNVGEGVRLDYGYLTGNKFTASGSWATPATAPTIDDIERVLTAASNNGSAIRHLIMDLATFNAIRKSKQGQELYARSVANFGTNLATANKAQFLSAFKDEFDADIIINDRSVNLEKNGVVTNVKAWTAGQIIFLQDLNVGSLVWSELAEKNHPVGGVEYSEVDQYILAAKFSVNEPTVAEKSRAQARVVPVIADVNNIYKLDTLTVGT